MAAVLQPGLDLCDLRTFRAEDLSDLLNEETRDWQELVDWDFGASANLVRRFTDIRGLTGAALVSNSRVVGYAYSVVEEHKGIIGDLYVRREFRSPEAEYTLLSQVLEDLLHAPGIQRVESQLILLGRRERTLPRSGNLQVFERDFLEIDLDEIDALPAAPVPGVSIEPWAQHQQDAAAHLIANAYVGHIDALINDQYRSLAGARRFLYNIVQFPGCGIFVNAPSLVAFERGTGAMCGMCLTSSVGPQVGHITQICLSREERGRKLGYEMLRQSLHLLRLNGFRRVSLTVTSSNRSAILLYQKVGFRSLTRFPAFVWEGFHGLRP